MGIWKKSSRLIRSGELAHPEIAAIDDQIQALISGASSARLAESSARRTSSANPSD